jgi:hypothetical protein
MSNQIQHFGVTDAQGNAVVVHWNVSGLHCSGLACGNIDADGNYTPPATVSQPLDITLEGVVISDPNYSVMTHVQIVPGTAPTPAAVPASNIQVSSAKQVAPSPITENAAIAASRAVPSNQPITPPPSVAVESDRQQTQQQPVQVIAAAPRVESRAVAPNTMSLPNAVSAAPVVNTASNSSHQQMPLPNAVAAAPVIKDKKRKSGDGMILLDLPSNVSNLTEPKKGEPVQTVASNAPLASENVSAAKKAAAPPVVASSTTTVSPATTLATPSAATVRSTTSATASSLVASVATNSPVLPSISSPATPTASKITPATKMEAQTQTAAIVATPAAVKPQPQAQLVASVVPPVVAKPSVAAPISTATTMTVGNATSSPNSVVSSAPSKASVSAGGTAEPAPAGTVVTYRDGKLKIDAENITLAEVLQLVAKKMGAVIDVPPGSGQERIVEHVGPGYPNDVLTRLLNGSHFNFIIVNSALRPNEPAEVLLSMQGTDAGAPAVAPAAPAATTSSALWTPPDPTLKPLTLPPQYDSSLAAPANKESLTPDAISQLMREKARELRERAMQQAGVSPDTSQPPAPAPAPTPAPEPPAPEPAPQQ